MIIKVRKKMYDSMDESIAFYLTNKETAMITHNYLSSNSEACVMVLNGTRKDDSNEDALLTSAEAKKFLNDLNDYLKERYPDRFKKRDDVGVA